MINHWENSISVSQNHITSIPQSLFLGYSCPYKFQMCWAFWVGWEMPSFYLKSSCMLTSPSVNIIYFSQMYNINESLVHYDWTLIFFKTELSIFLILFLAQLILSYYYTVLNNCADDQCLPKKSIVLGSNKIKYIHFSHHSHL